MIWIHNHGRFGAERLVDVRFSGPTPGLQVGTVVTYNGLIVGTVTRVSLDPSKPHVVDARLSISSEVPLAQSTAINIETLGLLGTVQVAMRGSPGDRRLDVEPDAAPPRLEAAASPNLAEEARMALREARDLVNSNAASLRATIANFQTFSSMLAENSERIGRIFAGAEQLFGAGSAAKPTPRTFDLILPASEPASALSGVQLAVMEPTSLAVIDTQRLLRHGPDGELIPASSQWSDTIPKLVHKKMLEALDQANVRFSAPPADGSSADHQLHVEVRKFSAALASPHVAEVALALRLTDRDGKIIDVHLATGASQAEAADGGPLAAAMSAAFGKAMTDTLQWLEPHLAGKR
jgi:phospholipid/cholesterol/gamma-HCH transport system substrate-binding protein